MAFQLKDLKKLTDWLKLLTNQKKAKAVGAATKPQEVKMFYGDDFGGGPLRGSIQNRIAALSRLSSEPEKRPSKSKTGKNRRRRRPDRRRRKNTYFSN